MSRPFKVLVMFDLPEPVEEQDFSEELKTPDWETERDVIKAVKALGHDMSYLGIFDDTTLITKKFKEYEPDIVFNLVERFRGLTHLDSDVVSFFKLKGIPFTGCGPTGLMLCKNKGVSKQILSFHRIRVPNFHILHRNHPIRRPRKLDFPIFIKPLKEEASYGISQASFVENDDQFQERVKYVHESLNQDVIAEEYIEGRELYVSMLGNKRINVFPIRELKFGDVPEDEPKIATFKAKWDEAYRKKWGIRNQFVGQLPNGTKKRIEKVCKKIYRLLSIRGYARIDLRLTPEGEIYFLEANPNPILAKWEDFSEAGMKTGLAYQDLIQKIIKLGMSADGEQV